jgi:hypothetical protein
MPILKPFRDYSEHDVINLFACDSIANKGTLVKPIRSWKDDNGSDSSNAGPLNMTSNGAGKKYTNIVNDIFEINGKVTPVVNYNDTPKPIGILLNDVKELDENGRKLLYDRRKMEEMGAVLKNYHSVPILTRGLILINDIEINNKTGGGGNPDIGDVAYVGNNGKIATDGVISIGTFLSPKDENGYCLVRISIL